MGSVHLLIMYVIKDINIRDPIEKLDFKNHVKNVIKNDVKNYVKKNIKNVVMNWDSF